jgi:hypothetical protein
MDGLEPSTQVEQTIGATAVRGFVAQSVNRLLIKGRYRDLYRSIDN